LSTPTPLGFGPSRRPQFVYVDKEKTPTLWYFWDATDKKAVPTDGPALTGYVTNAQIASKEFGRGANKKLHISISAGTQNYIVETGFYTAFARCLLGAFSQLTPEQIQTPIAIEPHAGESNTVFANVWLAEANQRLRYEYPNDDADVDRLYARVRLILSATGQLVSDNDEANQAESNDSSALRCIKDTPEIRAALVAYIRSIGPTVDTEAIEVTIGNSTHNLAERVRDHWPTIRKNFSQLLSIAEALEDASGVPFEAPVQAAK
jgi:hypothetical protein